MCSEVSTTKETIAVTSKPPPLSDDIIPARQHYNLQKPAAFLLIDPSQEFEKSKLERFSQLEETRCLHHLQVRAPRLLEHIAMRKLTQATDADVAATVPGATATSGGNTLQIFEQLLDHCEQSDLPKLLKLVNNKLSQGLSAYNTQNSRLVKLPTELTVEIGKMVLETHPEDVRDKEWFAAVLPLMQTCKELRSVLQPLRSIRLTYVLSLGVSEPGKLWDQVFEHLKAWRQKGSHEGRIQIFVRAPFESTHFEDPNTAAAMAGALECAIYGRLLDPPCVYIQCLELARRMPTMAHINYLVGHSREANIKEQKATSTSIRGVYDHSHRSLGHQEGSRVWYTAFRSSEDDGY